MTGELHWIETISLIAAMNLWEAGTSNPSRGILWTALGPKWLFASSVTLYGLGVLLVGFTHTAWYMLCVYGVVVAPPPLAPRSVCPMR